VIPDDGTRSVLITGCSTGIGRATALHLASRGFAVYATARRPETLEELGRAGCRTLRLDVTDEVSMQAALDAVERDGGIVDVLVNNAGYGLEGPVEELSLDEIRAQFETNLFGPTRLTQMVLPAMRERRRGRIINISSVGGRITTPGAGAYHASKHALEALSDALRFELRGFGVDVVVVEPGAIRSRWVDTAVRGLEDRIQPSGPYAKFNRAVVKQMYGAHEGLLGLAAGPPEAVARVIERAITATRPRRRYPVPAAAHLFIGLHHWLPSSLWDAFMRRMYPSPGIDE
jgi:NAD(P)-dependent dehydrogenase (short-subunit alcohol dehydrogenase family)